MLRVLLAVTALLFGAASTGVPPASAQISVRPKAAAADPTTVPAPGGPAPTPGHHMLSSWSLFTFGAMFEIMAHEFGHFMIGEFHIPATGPEEDVADEFAAMTFIANLKEAPQQTADMAIGGAEFWWFLAQDRGDNATPFYDEHAPDRARFAKYVCLLYGASPDMFNDLLDKAGIPARTKARCKMDEPKLYAAWQNLLTPYRRRGVNPGMPGAMDPNTPGHRITVVYQPTKIAALREYAQEIQDSGVFDVIADAISKLYVLPRDTKIVFRDCGLINCFYNPSDGSVTMCWEMISVVLTEFKKHGESMQASTPSNPDNGGGGTSMTLNEYLLGLWGEQLKMDNGDILVLAFKLDQNSAMKAAILKDKKTVVQMNGTWSAKSTGDNVGQLTLTWRSIDPPDVKLDPFVWNIQIIDKKSFKNADGTVERIE